MEKVTWKR